MEVLDANRKRPEEPKEPEDPEEPVEAGSKHVLLDDKTFFC